MSRLSQRVYNALRLEVSGLHPRLQLVLLLSRSKVLTKDGSVSDLLRRVGFQIGDETVVQAVPTITGGRNIYSNFTVGRGCLIECGLTLDLSEKVSIGNGVTIGPQCMILTSTHELGRRAQRAGNVVLQPVEIGDGCWIGPRAIILPGVKLCNGVVVEPGTVVNRDIAPNTRVAGHPARPLESLAD